MEHIYIYQISIINYKKITYQNFEFIFIGSFKENQFEGKGQQIYTNNQVYDGNFVKNMR